jgi:hypothetical protein
MADALVEKNEKGLSDYCTKRLFFDTPRIWHFFAKRDVCLSILIPTIASLLVILTLTGLMYSSAFAQQTPETVDQGKALKTPGNISSANNRKDTALNATGTNLPVVQKLSDKRNYMVQIRWGQNPSLLPTNGFDMEIVFLNASEPQATPQTFPQKETNASSDSPLGSTGYTEPSIIQRMVPIDSYDLIIYSDKGQELWKKINEQNIRAGRSYERITFANGYTGGITILINNIKSGGNMGATIGGTLSGSNQSNPGNEKLANDSVKFTARVTNVKP